MRSSTTDSRARSRKFRTTLKSFLRRHDGPLTQDLVQVAGEFGLGQVPAGAKPDGVASMICGFCSTGCSLNIHLQNGQAVSLTPDAEYPVNLGMACPKGWEALTPLHAEDRATTPLLRDESGRLKPVDWDAAMQVFALRLKVIQDKHGKESVAWLGTGQIVTEELAFLGALAKFGMGILHGDGNTRQCMATAATAYKQSFGFDAPPYSYMDFEESDLLVFIGSNLCVTHPILWQRVLRNKREPEIVVLDPRKTETAQAATRHYPIRPKSDLTFLYGMARILIEQNWIDQRYIEEHTSDFEQFKEHVNSFTPEMVSRASGISAKKMYELAEVIHASERASFWWTMGVNQGHQATRTAQAIINLALMTGNMGRPGTGANSITGQCNAMGSRLFSNTTNLLGGHDFMKPADRTKVAGLLGISPDLIPPENSWAYDQIIDGIVAGKIKGLWIIGTNPSHSWIDQTKFNRILDQLDFLVVQDMYTTTETAQRAHLLLPAAGWGEKEGTFINSERRIGLVKKVSKAPGQALSDFNIFKLAAHYWGCAELFTKWTSPESVFQILKQVTANQPCDITGIKDYRMIDQSGGIQWPFHGDDMVAARDRRLFEDGIYVHPDGRARFIFEKVNEAPELPDSEYPFILLTGRGTSSQWHTETRTGKSAVLRQLCPDRVYVEINPGDAKRLGITESEEVLVISRRGETRVAAFLTPTVQPGHVFMPMHYVETNPLISAVFDPCSRQPSYKASPVAIRSGKSGKSPRLD